MSHRDTYVSLVVPMYSPREEHKNEGVHYTTLFPFTFAARSGLVGGMLGRGVSLVV